jgi:hypothetical protein
MHTVNKTLRCAAIARHDRRCAASRGLYWCEAKRLSFPRRKKEAVAVCVVVKQFVLASGAKEADAITYL